jgi:hypothetical protein
LWLLPNPVEDVTTTFGDAPNVVIAGDAELPPNCGGLGAGGPCWPKGFMFADPNEGGPDDKLNPPGTAGWGC